MRVLVSGAFDGLEAAGVRLLQEAARLGEVQAVLWPDGTVERATGRPPRFPLAERRYLLEAVRFVARVLEPGRGSTPTPCRPSRRRPARPARPPSGSPRRGRTTRCGGLSPPGAGSASGCSPAASWAAFPRRTRRPRRPAGPPRKVVVTGCFDWLHSGHIRFFEQVAALGDLYVVLGHDANIRLLKGEGHPLFPAEERRWLVGTVRHVHRALVSSGSGWMDAEPEIERLRPDVYAVNEDGDRPEKRRFCERHGLEYVVLKRDPRPGLPRRTSTGLRGF